MSFQSILGENIKSNRLERDWSQKQLADHAGVGLNFVYQLEKGKKSVQLDSVLKVLGALDLAFDIIESEDTSFVQAPEVETYFNQDKKQFDPWAS